MSPKKGMKKPLEVGASKGSEKVASAATTINSLTLAKRRQVDFLKYLNNSGRPDLEDLHLSISRCSSWLVIREWIETGESKLFKANFCKKHLVCRACAVRRGAKNLAVFLDRVRVISAERPALIPAMLTVTVKNGHDLRERFQHLAHSWRIISKRVSCVKKGRRGKTELSKIAGGVRSCEVTRSEYGWHPHFHAFVLLEDYIDQAKFSQEWQQITGDSFAVGISAASGVESGLSEVFKYAVKFSDLSNADLVEAWQHLAGKRLISSWGCFYGVELPEIDSDDLTGISGAYRDILARWSWSSLSYSLDDFPTDNKTYEKNYSIIKR